MGVFDMMSQVGSWFKSRWDEDWHDVGKTFGESWDGFGDKSVRMMTGFTATALAPFKDDGDFWGTGRMWMDATVGTGSSVLGGTLGSLFQAPILHETGWLLDKAYRYGVARPLATPMIMATNNETEAFMQGVDSNGTFFDYMTDFNHLKRAWNDSEYVTPGQASVYLGTMAFQQTFDDYDDAMKWASLNDPRTPEGQLHYNSKDADTWLKYGSGSIDFAASVLIDPSHGASKLFKLGKLRLVDKVADARYVVAGKVTNEVGTTAFDKLRKVALETRSPEEFRDLTMPQAVRGNQAAAILWYAAKRPGTVFEDAYLTIRGFDPEAAQRLMNKAPDMASDFAAQFANFTLADWDFQRGQLVNAGADALRLGKLDAFVDSLAGKEGLWGQALGLGIGEKIPKKRVASKVRAGYHNFVLRSAPIIIGRPAANLMPSQGHTKMIDANDNTAFSSRQFKANLERAVTRESQALTPEELNGFVSRYGAATSDATRHTVAIEAENLVLTRMLNQFGLTKRELAKVIMWANETRSGTRRLISNSRLYLSDQAAKRAAIAAAAGDIEKANDLTAVADNIKKDAANGGIDEVIPFTDVDGRLNIVPVVQYLPILRSQFSESIVMMDYRALRASMRWWNIVHPKPKYLPDPDDVEKALKDPKHPVKHIKQEVTTWQHAFAKAAKARGWYQARITNLDAISSIWKATTLLRPAQAPRNLGSDWLLSFVEFGKMPLIMAAAQAPINIMRNFVGRTKLKYEVAREAIAARQADGTAIGQLHAEAELEVPGNLEPTPTQTDSYANAGQAYANGAWSLLDYANFLDHLFHTEVVPRSKRKPPPPPEASAPKKRSKDKIPQLFKPSATESVIAENKSSRGLSGNRSERIDPNLVPPSEGNPAQRPGYGEALEDEELSFGVEHPRAVPEGYGEHRNISMPDRTYPRGTEPGGFALGSIREPNPYTSGKLYDYVEAPYTPFRVGQPYFIEYVHWKEYKRTNDFPTFLRNISASAMSMSRRNLYQQKPWGLKVVGDLLKRHINRRSAEDYADNPYAPGTLVVDPFTGTQPHTLVRDLQANFDITPEAILQTRNVAKKKRGSVDSVARDDIRKQMVTWVNENVSRLLELDAMVAMRVKPDGNIAIGIARAKKHVVEAGETIKPGAKVRLKNFRFDGIRDMGHTGFEFKDKSGRVLMKLDGWAEGATGQQFQARISATDNPATQFGSLVNNVDTEDLMDEYGPQHNLAPQAEGYGEAWERAVNAQIASDPVASKFLERKSDGEYKNADDIYDEVISTAWGTKWMHAMSFRAASITSLIEEIGAMVNTYIPDPRLMGDANAKAVTSLREKVRQKKATYEDFESLYRQKDGSVVYDDMPQIHGPSVEHILGNARTWKGLRGTVRKIQKVISDMPVDKAARFPFMAMSYQRHGTELARIAAHHFPDGPLPAGTVNLIKGMALEKAYHDVRYRLYDTAQANDLASATRLLMPFSTAMMDTYIKYGRVIRENPMLLVQGAYYWDMFERNQMVQDENGYVANYEDGALKWYSVDPTTGAKTLVPDTKVGKHKYIQFQLPKELGNIIGKKYYGVDANPVFAVNKDTMNVFLNTPSGGPLVAFAANEFALDNPEFGESSFVKYFVLPYGPSADRTRALIPSTVRSSWDAFVADDGDMAQGHAAAIMQAEMTAYALGTRDTPPTFEEVREKAAGLRFLRFAAVFGSPASFQVVSPYQPYVDAYRQLLADPNTQKTAPEEFLRRHGDEYYAVMMSVTRNNMGLSATIQSSEAYDKYQALIQRYPEFGGLIVGDEGAGAFAKSVYEAQKEMKVGPGDGRTVRELLPLSDSVESVETKFRWIKYSQMMHLIEAAMVDRGLRSLRNRGGEDLLATKNKFVEENKYWVNPGTGVREVSPWYQDFMSSDRAAQEKRLDALTAIAGDPLLRNRDDIQGLSQYMFMRHKMQTEMQYWGFASLDNQQARGLRTKWDQQVHALVESNGAFADLWNRWLSQDDRLDIPKLTPTIGNPSTEIYGF